MADDDDLLADLLTFDERQSLLFEFQIGEQLVATPAEEGPADQTRSDGERSPRPGVSGVGRGAWRVESSGGCSPRPAPPPSRPVGGGGVCPSLQPAGAPGRPLPSPSAVRSGSPRSDGERSPRPGVSGVGRGAWRVESSGGCSPRPAPPPSRPVGGGGVCPSLQPAGAPGRPLPSPSAGPSRGDRAGLLIGDSIAGRAGFLRRVGDWEVAVWVPPARVGKTWAGCTRAGTLLWRALEWAASARARGLRPTEVAVWLGGNDVYPRQSPPGPMSARLWTDIRQTLLEVSERVAPVVIIGPTPRPARDAPQLWAERHRREPEEEEEEPAPMAEAQRRPLVGPGEVIWEGTIAFQHLDRLVTRWLRERQRGDAPRLRCVPVGKFVLERRREGKRSAYVISRAALAHFSGDGVHLSADGYQRVVAKPDWPEWLRLDGVARPR